MSPPSRVAATAMAALCLALLGATEGVHIGGTHTHPSTPSPAIVQSEPSTSNPDVGVRTLEGVRTRVELSDSVGQMQAGVAVASQYSFREAEQRYPDVLVKVGRGCLLPASGLPACVSPPYRSGARGALVVLSAAPRARTRFGAPQRDLPGEVRALAAPHCPRLAGRPPPAPHGAQAGTTHIRTRVPSY